MARKKNNETKAVVKVCCADCRNFTRDTEGISVNVNGEYFMGICSKGVKDGRIKTFANKLRECTLFKNK